MDNSYQKKNEQLGLNAGTSRHRLVQELLYSMACQLGSAICFQCSEPIESVLEMSIEHKKPWLDTGNASELFFNLSNIAFSHRKRNQPNRRSKGPSKLRKTLNNKQMWCFKCKTTKPSQEFNSDRSRWTHKDNL